MAATSAATPSREWIDAKRIVVVCKAAAETAAASERLRNNLCNAIATDTAKGTALPVVVAGFGDPAMFDAGSVVLLVNAAARPDGDGRLVSFGLRRWRVTGGDDNDMFGTPPRAVRASAGDTGPEFDAAITKALDAMLPWRPGDSH
jgi:hypothetical protein